MTDAGTIHSGRQPSVDSPILQGGRNNVKGPSLSRQAVFGRDSCCFSQLWSGRREPARGPMP